MAGQKVVYLKSRVIALDAYRRGAFNHLSFPDGTGEPWSDCWPDNANDNPEVVPSVQTLKANSAGRVLAEMGTVLLVFAFAAVVANVLI